MSSVTFIDDRRDVTAMLSFAIYFAHLRFISQYIFLRDARIALENLTINMFAAHITVANSEWQTPDMTRGQLVIWTWPCDADASYPIISYTGLYIEEMT